MWLECIISYWGDDEESPIPKRKIFKRSILVQSVNYTDAEAIATGWGNEQTSETFDIFPIKDMDVEEILVNQNDGVYFKCDCTWSELDIRGKLKTYKKKLLVEANNSSVASSIAFKKMREWYQDVSVKKVAQTDIEEIIFQNDLPI